ncbi:MAG: 4'-phosphopantetheinyl transferase superfamily protein [Bacteroidota bacterium]
MIGNDIVSLAEVGESRSTNERFLQKVLSPQERQWLDSQDDQEVALWTLWALKESSYKAHYKRYRYRSFAPKSFNCTVLPHGQTACIQVADSTYQGFWHIQDDVIHAVSHPDSLPKNQIWYNRLSQQIGVDSQRELSKSLQHALIVEIAQRFDLPEASLSINKLAGIPFLYQENQHLPIDLSLSHHGRWGGFAYLSATATCP